VQANAPTLVQCPATGCPPDEAGPPKDGGELVVHVEYEPAILCDLVEHDAWSRWIAENQILETLLFQDPWTGAITPRLAASFATVRLISPASSPAAAGMRFFGTGGVGTSSEAS